jgi:uncharacterized protein
MIGILGPDEIDAVLRRQRVGRLACSANDRPYVVPIAYAYDGSAIYGCSMPGRKVDVMREQPLVCFEVEEVISPVSWRCVLVEGVYEELADGDARRTALARLTPEGGRAVAPSHSANGQLIVFRLRPVASTGRFERHDA